MGRKNTWQEQYDLGVRYLSEGNYEEAIIAFTVAIEINPKRAEAYERLADAYAALGDIENAVEILRQGIEAIGDNTLFQDYIDELTIGMERFPESSSEPMPTPASSDPRVERQDTPDGGYFLYYYNAAGNMIRIESYRPDGTLQSIHYYSEAGEALRTEFYNPDGTLHSYDLYYYDIAGNWMREEHYNADGMQTEYWLSYYDEAEGNCMRKEHYDAAGNLSHTDTYN